MYYVYIYQAPPPKNILQPPLEQTLSVISITMG